MRKINCPICGKMLMLVSDDTYINFDMRKYTEKVYCSNCKRQIKFSEMKKDTSNNIV